MFSQLITYPPTGLYLFTDNNRNTRTRCSKLTIQHCHRSGVFSVNFEYISHLVSICNFEEVNASWARGVFRTLSHVYSVFKKAVNGFGRHLFLQKVSNIDIWESHKYASDMFKYLFPKFKSLLSDLTTMLSGVEELYLFADVLQENLMFHSKSLLCWPYLNAFEFYCISFCFSNFIFL